MIHHVEQNEMAVDLKISLYFEQLHDAELVDQFACGTFLVLERNLQGHCQTITCEPCGLLNNELLNLNLSIIIIIVIIIIIIIMIIIIHF